MSTISKADFAVRLSIVIVNHHAQRHVRRCLGSLWQHCRGIKPEVIVVDNGSFDGCREMLTAQFPSVIFVQSEKNIGVAGGYNLGARQASGIHLMFLHSEIELVEDSVTILLRWMDTLTHAGALGCLLLNSDRSVQTSCVRSFPTLTNQFFDSEYLRERFPDSSLWGQRVLHAKWPRQTEVDVVSGVCLVRRSNFERVGGFNEIFTAHGAEADLCFKLSASGSRVYFVPETSVMYHGSKGPSHSPGPALMVLTRESVFQFMTLHYGRFHGWAFRASMTVSAIVRLLLIPPMMPLGNVVVRHGRDSWRKWAMILRWSVGRSCVLPVESNKTV